MFLLKLGIRVGAFMLLVTKIAPEHKASNVLEVKPLCFGWVISKTYFDLLNISAHSIFDSFLSVGFNSEKPINWSLDIISYK